MQVCIHRGSEEIGGSCVELKSKGKRILLDLGLPLETTPPYDKYIPKLSGLDGSDDSLLGVFISHPHLDHFGLLSEISQTIPIGIGKTARAIIAAASPFLPANNPIAQQGWDYEPYTAIHVGPFTITPFLVDHSAYDAYALLVESNGKSLFYSGDFRAHGRKSALFQKNKRLLTNNVDTILLEGSSLGRLDEHTQFPTEQEIEQKLVDIFSDTSGLALVHTSSQNIDRIVSIYRASKKTGRTLVIDLYTAAVLAATGNNHIPQSHWSDIALFVPQLQRIHIKRHKMFSLMKTHSTNRLFKEAMEARPHNFTILFRPLHMNDINTMSTDLTTAIYIYSLWEGYWEQGSYDRVKDWLKEKNIHKINLHTSGHASIVDLKKFVKDVQPQCVVPIHSFNPDSYKNLFPAVTRHQDGTWWEV